MRKDQNRYWKEHYKKDATNELYNFYLSIRELIVKFYPQKAATIMNNDELLKLSEEADVKKIIREKILVTDDLQWFPVVKTPPTSQASAQPASSQTQTSQATSKSKSTTSSES
jgi:hypothetical protein